ncbi:enoyl-CoA hydratase-related protein [Thermodesulfobacteriota bacterium]
MTYEKIIYEVGENRVATVTLNDPQRMNPLSWEMLAELDSALKEAEDDEKVSAIIIKGAGRCFSSGYDLAAGAATGEEPRGRKDYGRSIWNSRAHVQGHIEYWMKIWNLWKPVVAQVHGYCLAGATELAAICDIMVVAEGTRFGSPVTRFMATGDTVAIYSWHAGLKVAKEMSLGRILSAEECVRYGFANYCFPADKIDEETIKIAERFAAIHPELLSLSKRVVNRTFELMGLRISLEYGGEFDSLSHFGQDYGFEKTMKEEGLSAGLKKLNEPWGGI